MQTLSKGYKKPDTGDRGSSFFPALEDNYVRLNSHSHDGSNSEKISSVYVQKGTQTLSNASWSSDLGGSNYKQSVTMPANWTFDNAVITFRVSGGPDDGFIIHPTVQKTGASTFDIWVNDNTLTLVAIYG